MQKVSQQKKKLWKDTKKGKEWMRAYQKKYKLENKERVKQWRINNYLLRKEENVAKGWGHYSKGKTCEKCSKPIVNVSKGKCFQCTMQKDILDDPKTARYRRKNPQKVKARKIVFSEIRSGRIIRGKCFVCDKPNAEAHHEDYGSPLSVTWLCKKHHVELESRK